MSNIRVAKIAASANTDITKELLVRNIGWGPSLIGLGFFIAMDGMYAASAGRAGSGQAFRRSRNGSGVATHFQPSHLRGSITSKSPMQLAGGYPVIKASRDGIIGQIC